MEGEKEEEKEGGEFGGIKRGKIGERREGEKKRSDFSGLRPKISKRKAGWMGRAFEEVGHGVIINPTLRAGW